MPTIHKTACRCGGTKTNGRCDRCHAARGKHDRTTTERGYGADWQRVSRRVRQLKPLCEVCEKQGKVTAASQVHHKIPIALAPHLRLDASNLMSVCGPCHAWLEGGAAGTGGDPSCAIPSTR